MFIQDKMSEWKEMWVNLKTLLGFGDLDPIFKVTGVFSRLQEDLMSIYLDSDLSPSMS